MKRHREHLGLERDTEVVGASDNTAERFVEDLDRPAELADGGDGAAEIERDLGARGRILGERGGGAQVRFELVAASVGRLGEAEFVQDATALTLLRRFVERPLQIGDGSVGGAPGTGLVGRRL